MIVKALSVDGSPSGPSPVSALNSGYYQESQWSRIKPTVLKSKVGWDKGRAGVSGRRNEPENRRKGERAEEKGDASLCVSSFAAGAQAPVLLKCLLGSPA